MSLNAGIVALGLILSISLTHAAPSQLPTFANVIEENGTVRITDGSSIFTFSKDHTFSQEPVDMSGRTVLGKWTTDSQGGLFTITGNWSWVNGASPLSDPRKMVMAIYSGEFGTTYLRCSGKTLRVYKCYFEIEELVKTPAKDSAKQGQ